MAVVDKVLVGEALVVTEGGDNEISHIDLLMGPRGSAVEDAFCNTLCNNKDGFTSLLAVVSPNLLCKPATAMFNKVTIKGAKQAVQMFGPAQAAVEFGQSSCQVESQSIFFQQQSRSQRPTHSRPRRKAKSEGPLHQDRRPHLARSKTKSNI